MLYLIGLTSSVEYEKPTDSERIETLVIQTHSGDQAAFAALYELTKTAVYGFVLSIVKNAHDAEDILQETYIKIHSADYQAQGKPMAWILTIAKRLALMQLRGGKADMSDYEWESYFHDHPQLAHDDRLVLRAALEQLSDEEREVLSLHALAGYKHREISDFMQIPLATVLSKYHRALKKLKNTLAEDKNDG